MPDSTRTGAAFGFVLSIPASLLFVLSIGSTSAATRPPPEAALDNAQLADEANDARTDGGGIAAAAPAEDGAADVGSVLPGDPDTLAIDLAPPTLDRIRRHLEAGDTDRALHAAEGYAASHPTGRDADAARMVVGLIDREREHHNVAAEAFAPIRTGGGPLAPLAAYYEAEQDHLRGRDADAIKVCDEYRRRWPNAVHAVDCLRILAHAHARTGNASLARKAAGDYDKERSTARISEQIELALGRELADVRPADAAAILRPLAVLHSAPLTGRVAEEELARLKKGGLGAAVIPDDPDSRMTRALSLRDSGRLDAAWTEYEALRALAPRNTKIAAFVEDEMERFGWQTHAWTFLADEYDRRFKATRDAEWAWKRYKVLARGGRYPEAASFAAEMQAKYSTGHWKRSEEEIGRTMLLAKQYPAARAQFDAVAARGGWTGRRAQFEAAFAAHMAGEDADAVARFSALIDADASSVVESRYWRSRSYRRLDKPAEAAADEAWIIGTEPWSWYASLLRAGADGQPTIAPYARDGSWAGSKPLADPGPAILELPTVPVVVRGAGADAGDIPRPTPVAAAAVDAAPGFASWRWGALPPYQPAVRATLPPRADPEIDPPSSYRAGALFDPASGRRNLAKFADDYAQKWPELQAISDLASVGLYDLSGVMLGDWYELWQLQARKRDATARRLNGTAPEAWRELFLAARDHHDTARFLYGIWETLPAEDAPEAYRLGYPLAHDRYVWTHARDHDLDPFLVLGLMRQESTYNASARSRVGARGAMQIMPRTGHLLADLAHDVRFDAGDLEDPTLAVGYGIRYIGLLMERFGGVYPLAVASYNGGPFNVSAWLQGTGMDMPLDAFVEHIPYRETRDYVKKVSEGYAAYIALYGPNGAALTLPPRPVVDRKEVVDF